MCQCLGPRGFRPGANANATGEGKHPLQSSSFVRLGLFVGSNINNGTLQRGEGTGGCPGTEVIGSMVRING